MDSFLIDYYFSPYFFGFFCCVVVGIVRHHILWPRVEYHMTLRIHVMFGHMALSEDCGVIHSDNIHRILEKCKFSSVGNFLCVFFFVCFVCVSRMAIVSRSLLLCVMREQNLDESDCIPKLYRNPAIHRLQYECSIIFMEHFALIRTSFYQ